MRRPTRCKGKVASAEGRGQRGSCCRGVVCGAVVAVFRPRDLNLRPRSSEAEEVSGLEGKMLL